MHPFEQAWTILKCAMLVYGGLMTFKFFGWAFLYLRTQEGW